MIRPAATKTQPSVPVRRQCGRSLRAHQLTRGRRGVWASSSIRVGYTYHEYLHPITNTSNQFRAGGRAKESPSTPRELVSEVPRRPDRAITWIVIGKRQQRLRALLPVISRYRARYSAKPSTCFGISKLHSVQKSSSNLSSSVAKALPPR